MQLRACMRCGQQRQLQRPWCRTRALQPVNLLAAESRAVHVCSDAGSPWTLRGLPHLPDALQVGHAQLCPGAVSGNAQEPAGLAAANSLHRKLHPAVPRMPCAQAQPDIACPAQVFGPTEACQGGCCLSCCRSEHLLLCCEQGALIIQSSIPEAAICSNGSPVVHHGGFQV